MGGLITEIISGSIAATIGIKPGDMLMSVNGCQMADIIDYRYATADDLLELELLRPDNSHYRLSVKKDVDQELGLVFAANVFDRIRCCANHCIFCFIDQLQPSPRLGLLLKDDDYRMSFLEGNFITCTNLRDEDYQRIAELRLSPLYVSVHSTDALLRQHMLQIKKNADIMPVLRRLIDCGCTIHAQIVLCPGINDGRELEKTINDLAALFPDVASIAVVPVGLTKYNKCNRLRLYTPGKAADLLDYIAIRQAEFRKLYDTSLVFAADELYIKAGRAIPDAEHYEDFPQIENGVGMAAAFLKQWRRLKNRLPKEFACSRQAACSQRADSGRWALITGVNGRAVMDEVYRDLSKIKGLSVDLLVVENVLYGNSVTATGLLSGCCLSTLPVAVYDKMFIPANMLKFDQNIFLDDMTLDDLTKKLQTQIVAVEPNAAALTTALFGQRLSPRRIVGCRRRK